MQSTKCKLLFSAALLGGCISAAMAEDAVTEQYNLAAARKANARAETEVADISEQLRLQEKRVAQEQARLKELQKNLSGAKIRLATARAQLDQQQKLLDTAVKPGGH